MTSLKHTVAMVVLNPIAMAVAFAAILAVAIRPTTSTTAPQPGGATVVQISADPHQAIGALTDVFDNSSAPVIPPPSGTAAVMPSDSPGSVPGRATAVPSPPTAPESRTTCPPHTCPR